MSTLSTAARNAACNAVVDLVDAGSGAGKLVYRASSTVLATFTLNDPAFGDAAAGVATASGFPKTVVAVADGTADNYIVTDSDNVTIISGSLASVPIANGQTVRCTSLTHTQPAS